MSDSEGNSKTNTNKDDVDIPYKIEESDTDFIDHNRITLLSKIFTEKQMERYGEFKKSSIENRKKIRSTNKIEYPRIKKIVQSVLGENIAISNSVQIVMHGIAKIHAGQLIEEAKKILFEESLENYDKKPKPILPKHLRESRRRLMNRGLIPTFNSSYPLNK